MDLEKYIQDINHWHILSKVDEIFLGKERVYLEEIYNKITNRKILSITGIRRSGKSTLVFQTINKLINSGVDPKKILYVKIDDLGDEINVFDDILEKYEEMYGFSIKKDKCYVFVDEIQLLKNWHKQFKKYIDYKYNTSFIITGSSMSLIYKDATESLMGRIIFIKIYPLTFREFLQFNDFEVPKVDFKTNFSNLSNLKSLITNEKKILNYFKEYLEVGGFPEWFEEKNLNLWRNLLKESYLNLFLYKDVVSVYNVRNPKILEKLFIYLCKHSSERFSYNKVAQILDIDNETVKQYVGYLENSGFIIIADKYSKKGSFNERSEKKVYVWEEGLRRAVSFTDSDDVSYENLVCWHMQKIGSKNMFEYKPKYYYVKYEVDYIYENYSKNIIIPIEVKNSSSVELNLKGLREFMIEYNSEIGIVVTKNRFEYKENILYIPLWLFLLYID